MTAAIVREPFDVTLYASNVEELSNFYANLGLRRAVDDDDVKVFILGTNELEIHHAPRPPDGAATIEVQVNELAPVEHRLKQADIAYERPPLTDERKVFVRDPNGNLVSFVEARI
jgi:catechol 2,3-dioxygenase-like lactoylglutathione lyase family enzyme